MANTIARFAAAASFGYLCLAYLLAPGFWTLRDRRLLQASETLLTATPQGIPGDPINVALIGSKGELIHAFALADWHAADRLTLRTAIEIGESVVFDRPYADAPVSTLTFEGRMQDLSFEKPVGSSPDSRHHVRFWLAQAQGEDGRPVWLGAASFDESVGLSHDTGQITHHIAPDIDVERDSLVDGLQAAGALVSLTEIEGVGAIENGRNGGGDPYHTDGRIKLGVLPVVP